MYRIRHKHTRNQTVIIGSSAIALNSEGVAEVDEVTYNSVKGLGNWEQLGGESGIDNEAVAETSSDVDLSVQTSDEIDGFVSTINDIKRQLSDKESEIRDLKQELKRRDDTIEELKQKVVELETHSGSGKSLEQVLPKGRPRTRKV